MIQSKSKIKVDQVEHTLPKEKSAPTINPAN